MSISPPPTSSGWETPAVPAAASGTPSGWRRVWSLTGSITLAVVSAFLVMAVAGGDLEGRGAFGSVMGAVAVAGAFPMLGVSVLLIWRHRFPTLVAVLAIGLTLLVPTTALPALVALAAYAAVHRGGRLWGMIVAAYAATLVSFVWDVAAPTSYIASFVGDPPAATPARDALFWATPVLAALVVAPFAAYGMARRVRRERDAARQENAADGRNMAALHREVSVERERQELAREIHDTLAARLSTLSLHAGALEMTVGSADARAAAAARTVREAAQSSLDDLHHVVDVLRDPAAHSVAGETGINNLGALVDATLREGTDIRAQVLVGDPASCDPRVAHACYRLVQESISNVRRHAPGATLYVEVRGGPETGLTVRAVNWLTPGSPRATGGGGNGLTGMSERAALLGGTFQAGPTEEGAFAVVAWLPWKARSLD